MSFEFFKAFPPDRDSAIVELHIRRGKEVDIPAEVHRGGGELRITVFPRSDGMTWDYAVDEWIAAIQRAAEILSDD